MLKLCSNIQICIFYWKTGQHIKKVYFAVYANTGKLHAFLCILYMGQHFQLQNSYIYSHPRTGSFPTFLHKLNFM